MSMTVRDEVLYVDVGTWAAMIGRPVDEQWRAIAAHVPGGELALATVQAPEAVLQLQTATPGGVFTHEAWVDADTAAVLIDLGAGSERRVLPLPPDHLAAALARLVGLGPRPGPGRTGLERAARPVDEEVLGRWFDEDPALRAEALTPLGADRAWRLVVSGVGSQAAPMMLAAADGADGGVWVVDTAEREGDPLRLVPSTPTAIWRELTGLLPALDAPAESTAAP